MNYTPYITEFHEHDYNGMLMGNFAKRSQQLLSKYVENIIGRTLFLYSVRL